MPAHHLELCKSIDEPFLGVGYTLHDLLLFVHAELVIFLRFVNNFTEFGDPLRFKRICTPLDGCVKFVPQLLNNLNFSLEHDLQVRRDANLLLKLGLIHFSHQRLDLVKVIFLRLVAVAVLLRQIDNAGHKFDFVLNFLDFGLQARFAYRLLQGFSVLDKALELWDARICTFK